MRTVAKLARTIVDSLIRLDLQLPAHPNRRTGKAFIGKMARSSAPSSASRIGESLRQTAAIVLFDGTTSN